MHCCTRLAPITPTSLSPATTFACATALSRPSLTNLKGDPSINLLLRNRMGNNKDRYAQRMPATPPVGKVERPPSGHQSPCRRTRIPKVLGGLRRDFEY